MDGTLNAYKKHVQKSALVAVIGAYEPYQSFSNVFIGNIVTIVSKMFSFVFLFIFVSVGKASIRS